MQKQTLAGLPAQGLVEKRSLSPGEDVEKYGHGPLHDTGKDLPLTTRLGISPDSFRRADTVMVPNDPNDPSAGYHEEAPTLRHVMKNRHLQMIAVGGSIGTGLFIGSGGALARGGPLGVLLAWVIMGIMLFCVVHAMGELAVMYPVEGGFYTMANRFLDPAWGFAMGWNYVFQWVIVLPLELTAASLTVQYWDTDGSISIAVWITIFWVFIILINVFGALGFAEEEFWASAWKLLIVIMFIFIAIIMNCGGGPSSGAYSEYVGGRYWRDPGPLANGFKGVASVFVTAAFSFAGTELVGLAAAESANPRKNLPSAIKQVFWRITIFYILTLLLIGLLLPYNEPRLTGGANSYDARASPFVIVVAKAGIKGVDHLVNVTVMISVLSIANACVYGGSRTLCALAQQGFAPKFFAYIDKCGRPLTATVLSLLFGPLAYVNLAAQGGDVFDWLLAVAGLSTLFTWGSICLCHIRFRQGWRAQGHSVREIPVQAAWGEFGSYFGLFLVIFVLALQLYVAVSPLGGPASAEGFFKAYLAAPVVIVFYIIGYFIFKTRPVGVLQMDLDTGRKVWDTVEEIEADKAMAKQQPAYVRIYKFFC
ncbi:amino acid permease-domain-containing protein [Protomyces lactucae-debilis]|uniref:Amino acid permease-domain-containing protein n=1 Tax=Protomyces lactucae-debilis TaxID=2754530 RepID=A0A1Y2FXJ2_PROLT|nr:amino acid permease-domain-containing protein [Protomyces lactucae-debilis]ORY87896.1 amino acid permease-domain-containing protein [Protomyces lactucae-debilis]